MIGFRLLLAIIEVMSREKMNNSDRTKNSIVDFSEITKNRLTLSRQAIQNDSPIVQHDVLPPGEIEHPPSTHHFMALHLIPSTRRVAQIGKQQYEGLMAAGEFCLHPSVYSGFYAWETTDEIVTFIFKSDWLSRIAAQTECINPDRIELHPIVRDRDLQIEYIARSFLAEMQSDGLGGRLYCESLATQFAIHLLRNYCTFPLQLKQYSGGLSRRQLKAVIGYIDAHLEDELNLKTLAQVAQIDSDHYFCRLFKQSTGIAPYQYVIQQRIEKAKQLLKQENLPLAEIALMCGFCNQSAFSRTFRKLMGTTPRGYRKEL